MASLIPGFWLGIESIARRSKEKGEKGFAPVGALRRVPSPAQGAGADGPPSSQVHQIAKELRLPDMEAEPRGCR
jgi:hypothetical protein